MDFIHDIYWNRVNARQKIYKKKYDPFMEDSEEQIFQRYRFRKNDIEKICEMLKKDLEFEYRRKGHMPVHMQVLVALRFYATGSLQEVVGDTVHVHKSTASRTIHRVTNALKAHATEVIKFPSGQSQLHYQKRKFYEMAGFPHVFGVIDGTQVQIQGPTENEHEFVNRKGKHSINVQLVCDSKLRIIHCNVKNPGSVHDARVLKESSLWRAMEGTSRPVNGIILGDSAYPLRDWLMTPFLNPRDEAERRFNEAQKSTRVTVERCIGVLKRRFQCLHGELRYAPAKACGIITACIVLHNLAIEFGTPEPNPLEPDDVQNEIDNQYPVFANLSGRAARQQIVQRCFTQ